MPSGEKCFDCGAPVPVFRCAMRAKRDGRYGPQLAGWNLCEKCAHRLLERVGLILKDGFPMRRQDVERAS